jgi:hypothetical protein
MRWLGLKKLVVSASKGGSFDLSNPRVSSAGVLQDDREVLSLVLGVLDRMLQLE